MRIIKRLFAIGASFRLWFIIALIVSVLVSIIAAYRPILTREVVDSIILVAKSRSELVRFSWLLFALVVAESILNWALVYLSSFIAQSVIRDLRERLYNKILYFRTAYFDKTAIGQLVTRAVGDVETIATVYTDGFLMVFGDILKVGMVLFAMFTVNVQLSFVALAILPLMVLITRFFQSRLKKAFGEERSLTSAQNSFVQERLGGLGLIQVFNRQKAEFLKFEKINTELKSALLRTVFFFSLFFPVVDLISSIFIGFILYYAGYNALYSANASAGDVIAFIQFITMLIRPLRQIADRFNNLQRGLVGAERVLGAMDENQEMPNMGSLSADNIQGHIRFENVEFSYGDRQKVLHGVNFEVKAGQTVALVGATGAGKTTIISLLSRFYDIDSGNIFIDGKEIKEYDLFSLRSNLGVVLQDVFLFKGSIWENIVMGNENITKDQIHQIATKIGLQPFIDQLPEQYDYQVSERGASMSLGQRQLLSFLRAYVIGPKILILDEATSSIDPESEYLIQQATEQITQGRTSIIIAHRLSTIIGADKIIVMDKGKVVEEGTHQTLLAKKGYYSRLYELQLKKSHPNLS